MLKTIEDFDFPTLTDNQIVFSTLNTNHALLELAKQKGFNKSSNPYNELFNQLFFKGGKLNFKANLKPEFKEKATRYLKAYMTSFSPRHQEKEAVSALILSALVDL